MSQAMTSACKPREVLQPLRTDMSEERSCPACDSAEQQEGPRCCDLSDPDIFPELAQTMPDVAACSQLAHYIDTCLVCQSGSGNCQNLPERSNAFQGRKPPPITLRTYVYRLAKHAQCSPVCFIIALCFMRKLQQRDVSYKACPLSVHRLLLVSLMVAAKQCDDRYFSNAYYSKIGGISNQEINTLELELLDLLDFRTNVSCHDIWLQLKAVRAASSCRSTSLGRSQSLASHSTAGGQACDSFVGAGQTAEKGMLVSPVHC